MIADGLFYVAATTASIAAPLVLTGCGGGGGGSSPTATTPVDDPVPVVDTTAPTIRSFTSSNSVIGSENLYKLGIATNFAVDAFDEESDTLRFTYRFGDGGGVVAGANSAESNTYPLPGEYTADALVSNDAGLTSPRTELDVFVTQYTAEGILESKELFGDLELIADTDVIGGTEVNKSVWGKYMKEKLAAGDVDAVNTLAVINEFENQEATGAGINAGFANIDEIVNVRYAEKNGRAFLVYEMKILDASKFNGYSTTHHVVRELLANADVDVETMKTKIKGVINDPITAAEGQDLLTRVAPDDADEVGGQPDVDYSQRQITLPGTAGQINITGSARYKIGGVDKTAVFDYHANGGTEQAEITTHRGLFGQLGDDPVVNYGSFTAQSAELGTAATTFHAIYKRIVDTFKFHTAQTQ